LVQSKIQSGRHSTSSFPSRIESVNFDSRIPQAKYSVETAPPTEVNYEQPQSPTYSALGAELGVLEKDFQIDKEKLRANFYSQENIFKRTWFF